MAYFDGVTKDGVHVHIEDDPYTIKPDTDPRVLFDGEVVEVKAAARRRDGGSTQLITDRGELWINAYLGWRPNGILATLDGEVFAEVNDSPILARGGEPDG